MSDTAVETPKKSSAPVNAIIEKYIALRDLKATKTAAHKKEMEGINTALERVEAFLLKTFQELGVDSLKTSLGTAYTQVRCSASVNDWEATLAFIKENDQWAFLEKRVSKDAIEAWKTEHNDLPPGINWREERVVNIRRT